MKRFHILLIAVLVLTLVLGLSCTVFAAEADNSESGGPELAGAVSGMVPAGIIVDQAELYQAGSFEPNELLIMEARGEDMTAVEINACSEDGMAFLSGFTYDYTAFDTLVYEALKAQQEVIDISQFNFPYNPAPEEGVHPYGDLADAYAAVINNHPDLFYIGAQYGIQLTHEYKVFNLVPTYVDHLAAEIPAFDAAVAALRADLFPEGAVLTDEEKVLIAHDWLVLNCEYDEKNYVLEYLSIRDAIENNRNEYTAYIPDESYCAYGPIMDGVAVCQGYTLALNLLLELEGIDCMLVPSDEMGHAWSLVNLGEDWYHVDSTWNDPTPGVGYDLVPESESIYGFPGRVGHDFFLLSDSTIQNMADSNDNHYGFTTGLEAEAMDSTKYEASYPFCGSESPFYYVDGLYYYFVNESEVGSSIVKSKFDGTEAAEVYALTYPGDEYYNYACEARAMQLVGDTLYFINGSMYSNLNEYVMSCKLDGSNPEVIAEITDKYEGAYYLCGLDIVTIDSVDYLLWYKQLYSTTREILLMFDTELFLENNTLTLSLGPNFFLVDAEDQESLTYIFAGVYSGEGQLQEIIQIAIPSVGALRYAGGDEYVFKNADENTTIKIFYMSDIAKPLANMIFM